MMQEARAGVVSRTWPTEVGSMVVELLRKMGVGVFFRVRKLKGTLAGVMKCVEGSVVAGTSAGLVGRGC